MGIRFNADEVLEMASRIERNGAVFYRKAAENNDEGRGLLLKIAEQEDEHLVIFEEMRKNLTKKETEPTIFDPDGELSQYLKAMADGHVFDLKNNDPAGALTGEETLDEIIETAIQAEKDSIAFFAAMKEWVPRHQGQDQMSLLIREEMKHVRWLNDRRSTGSD